MMIMKGILLLMNAFIKEEMNLMKIEILNILERKVNMFIINKILII